MADMIAVLWHVKTYTSAKVSRSQVEDQIVKRLGSDPAWANSIVTWCTTNGVALDDCLLDIVENSYRGQNKRSKFTALDSQSRLDALEQAVTAAREWATSKGTPDVVFVAPEYLFAKDGYRHLLNGTEVGPIRTRLASISRKVPHVLMFPGTIAARRSMAGESVRSRVQLFEDSAFWNKTGNKGMAGHISAENEAKIRQIAMRGLSFDVAQNKSFAFMNGKTLMEYTKRGDFHEVTASEHTGKEVYVPGQSAGTLTAFGKAFGVEICLDHNMGYAAWGGGQPDVHVLMSASVEPVAAHETSVGRNPGKVGFVVHASCDAAATQVVRWASGQRSIVQSTWDKKLTYGTLHGYALDFSTTKEQAFTGTKGKVAALKSKFGTP